LAEAGEGEELRHDDDADEEDLVEEGDVEGFDAVEFGEVSVVVVAGVVAERGGLGGDQSGLFGV
jgi:hypothetical protein